MINPNTGKGKIHCYLQSDLSTLTAAQMLEKPNVTRLFTFPWKAQCCLTVDCFVPGLTT